MYDSIGTSCDNRRFQAANFSIDNISFMVLSTCSKVTNELIYFILRKPNRNINCIKILHIELQMIPLSRICIKTISLKGG